MRGFLTWIVTLALAALLVLGVVFLPEYITDQYDTEYLNSYRLYAEKQSDAMNTSLTPAEKLSILGEGDKNIVDVVVKEDYQELKKNDSRLLERLEEEIIKLEDKSLLPVVSDKLDMKKDYDYARLIAVTVSYKPGKIIYLWKVAFTTGYGSDMDFWVDADTYQIYMAELVCSSAVSPYINEIREKWAEDEKGIATAWGIDGKRIAEHWGRAYVDYLWGEEEKETGDEKEGEKIIVSDSDIIFATKDTVSCSMEFWISDIGEINCSMYGYGVDEVDGEYGDFRFEVENFNDGYIKMNESGSKSMYEDGFSESAAY